MEQLNNKVISSSDETLFSAQVSGLYGFDSTADKWRRVAVNTNGELEMTAEITSAGLATEAKQDTMITHLADIDNQTNSLLTYQVLINQTQSNGNQVVKCMGNNGGNNVQLKVDANGVLETSGGGGGSTQYNMGSAVGATPTGTIALGRDTSGNAQALQVSSAGNQFVELADFAKGQTNMASSFCVNVASDQSALDVSKMTQGYDASIASGGSGLQQNLVYGLDIGGNLDALRVDSSGHLEVTVDDFVKSQASMANSFPVVIASDQSRINVQTNQSISTISQVNQVITSGNTFTSTAVDMDGYNRLSFFGSTTNSTDQVNILYSADDITYYKSGDVITPDFSSGDFSFNAEPAMRYIKLQQGTASLGAGMTISCISSKK